MTQFPEEHPGLEAKLDRLLDPAVDPQDFSGDLPRLAALLAAATAVPDEGPQPGETAALDAFRELVTEAAGTPSLVRRNRRRAVVIASASTIGMLASGVAAAATGSLPGAAQQTAKTVLGVIGVSVPGPDAHAGDHPDGRGQSSAHVPAFVPPVPTAVPTDLPTPSAHPAPQTTPLNSAAARHHGTRTTAKRHNPAAARKHGKPSSPPVVATVHRSTPRVSHVHPNATPYRVMRGSDRPITH